MANDLLNPPEIETSAKDASQDSYVAGTHAPAPYTAETGHELDAFLGKAFEEKSAWASLYESVHELFFPVKLPPLELTSTPIPVPDRMATKWSPVAWAIAAVANFAILAILLFAFRRQINKILPPTLQLTNLDMPAPYKPKTPKPGNIGGGGGGGQHELTPASKGKLPKFDPKPIVTPMIAKIDKPTSPMDPKIDIQPNIKLPDNPNLPNFGATQGPSVVLSNGSGSNGIGNGKGGGVGSGNGAGFGPGTGGNVGGGLRRIGDGVTEPKPIFAPEAEFSDEARRAKYEGTVVVTLIVDAQGNPQNVHVTRSLGMGLDEKALEAVRQYKFKPAMDRSTNKPVPVMLSIEVRFRLY
jgi:TonB family protein